MLDRQSEIIAHFIGQLNQASESLILRMQYDDIRAVQAQVDAANAILHVEVNISAVMGLTDFYAALGLRLPGGEPPVAMAPGVTVDVGWPLMPNLDAQYHFDYMRDYADSLANPGNLTIFQLEPPGGQIAVVLQKNWLHDDDLLIDRDLTLPQDLLAAHSQAAIAAQFGALVAMAEALDPAATALHDDGTFASAETIGTSLDVFAELDVHAGPAGAEISLHWSSSHGETGADPVPEGDGVLIGGALADELPDTLAVRLEGRAEDYTPDEGDEAEAGSGEDAPELHLIQTGDNLLFNEGGLSLNWVDAPTIAVAGGVHQLAIISQINVLSDRDDLYGPGAQGAHGGQASQAFNIAAVNQQANPIDWPHADPEHEGGPQAYAIAELEGDLVMRSYTVQINLVSDDDVVSFETTFHEVDIGLGANAVTNLALWQGFQFGFEAIFVGGDMINLASIYQLNVLGDDDLVAADGGVAGDISTSGNLLWNEASLGWTGIDTETEMTDGVMNALATLTEEDDFNPFTLDGEAFLEHSPVGVLLTIGGDLISEHHLVQINMLSDADTVQLHAAELEGAGFDPIDLETGDNVLANVANLSVNGIDSAVMAGGGVYSDVVIYQAGMFDDGAQAAADGETVLGGALASEAVAFLVDGMIAPGPSAQEGADGGPSHAANGCDSGTHDALGTMVA